MPNRRRLKSPAAFFLCLTPAETGCSPRGVVTDEELAQLTTETVLRFLGDLPWHLYGGSYFKTAGKVGKGRLFS